MSWFNGFRIIIIIKTQKEILDGLNVCTTNTHTPSNMCSVWLLCFPLPLTVAGFQMLAEGWNRADKRRRSIIWRGNCCCLTSYLCWEALVWASWWNSKWTPSTWVPRSFLQMSEWVHCCCPVKSSWCDTCNKTKPVAWDNTRNDRNLNPTPSASYKMGTPWKQDTLSVDVHALCTHLLQGLTVDTQGGYLEA